MNRCEGCGAAYRPDDEGRCWYCKTPIEGVYQMPCNDYDLSGWGVSSMSWGFGPEPVLSKSFDNTSTEPVILTGGRLQAIKLELGRQLLQAFHLRTR